MRTATPDQLKDVNARYHDLAAADYDSKWGIDFGEIGQQQVVGKVEKALGGHPGHFENALEVGAGTGYFGLNLLRAGLIDRLTATDISQGMLDALSTTAGELGLSVGCTPCDAEELPFEDGSFDLVLGHAILHHLPNLVQAFAEFHRVLVPGGTLLFCGEPSRYGDRVASVPKRAGSLLRPLWRTALRIGPRGTDETVEGEGPGEQDRLEPYVDLHAFTPGDLTALAEESGFEEVAVRGEELLANLFGWTARSLEAGADWTEIPWAWRNFAYRAYIALQTVDGRLLEPYLPPSLFYNLIVTARKPDA